MSNLDQKNAEFADDDIIQITNLAPAGASPYKHAQRALALVLKGITTPWIRYSLAGLLILALLSALLPQLHALTSSASSPNTSVTEPHSLALVSANGQVFVQSVNNLLIAFQASSGRRLWQQQLSNVATLSATGQALYFYYVNNNGSSATFEALDTSTGKPIWQKSSFPLSQAISRGEQPGFILSGAILYTAGPTDGINAFQASNGHFLWSFNAGAMNLPLSTALYAQNGIVEIHGSDSTVVHILNASSGHEIAHAPANNDGTPLPIDGQLIYALPRSTIQAPDQPIQVFHAPDGTLLWSLHLPYGAGGIQEQDGVVYYTNLNHSSLTALRGSDGHALWTYQTSDHAAMIGTFLEQGGLLYLLQHDTALLSIRVSDGYILWSRKLTAFSTLVNTSTLQPLIDQNILFYYAPIPSGASSPQYIQIAALNSNNGRELWHTHYGSGQPVPLAGVLYFLQDDGRVDTWRESDGHSLWSYDMPSAASIMATFPGIILLVDKNANLDVVHNSDGQQLWHYP